MEIYHHAQIYECDVAVIGAGAAGMMCAATASQSGKTVFLLEHNKVSGKKILISGGGRCNFTNIGDETNFELFFFAHDTVLGAEEDEDLDDHPGGLTVDFKLSNKYLTSTSDIPTSYSIRIGDEQLILSLTSTSTVMRSPGLKILPEFGLGFTLTNLTVGVEGFFSSE